MSLSAALRRAAASDGVAQLLQRGTLWRGVQPAAGGRQGAIPTGWDALDAELPGSGWPVGALTELLSDMHGIGELSLLLPALRHLSHTGSMLAWIGSPELPWAPALAAAGIDLNQLLLVRPDAAADILWAAEQALRSGACGAVLIWPQRIRPAQLRRLQLAAERGGSAGFLYRGEQALKTPSPAALRLALAPSEAGVAVRICKRRGGGRPAHPLYLHWSTTERG